MTRARQLKHRFVEFIPDEIEDATLYVSMEYGTVRHKCCCGCGEHVVTPLSPTDWKLIFDGETISLHPSIGNRSYTCRSHYWIRNGAAVWAPQQTDAEVEATRRSDRRNKDAYYAGHAGHVAPAAVVAAAEPTDVSLVPAGGLLSRLSRCFASLLAR